MSSQPQFCTHCGARLTPGSTFCTSCGQPVAASTAPPPGPTTPPPPSSPPPPSPPPAASWPTPASRPTTRARGSSIGSRIGLTLVGLFILFLGLRGPLLQVAGVTASGVITDVSRDTSSDSRYDYIIKYEFVTADGKTHSGSTTRSDVFDVTRLPSTGAAMTVRYLPALPFVNAPAGETGMSIGSIVMVVLGLGMAVLAWRH